jgi:hypothetical protein
MSTRAWLPAAFLLLVSGCTDRGTDPGKKPTPGELGPFRTAAECGVCHPQHLAEWETSMHAFAGVDPVMLAMSSLAAAAELQGARGRDLAADLDLRLFVVGRVDVRLGHDVDVLVALDGLDDHAERRDVRAGAEQLPGAAEQRTEHTTGEPLQGRGREHQRADVGRGRRSDQADTCPL